MRNPNIARTRGLYEILMEPKDMTIWPVRPTRGVNRGYRDGVLRPDGTLTTYVSAGTPVDLSWRPAYRRISTATRSSPNRRATWFTG